MCGRLRLTLAALGLAILANPAAAACLSDDEIANLVAAYQALRPAPNPQGLTAADAQCSRDKFNTALAGILGQPVGYKAGLTNPAVQKRFHYHAPVRGTLYAPMLLASGARVPAAFGARPMFEADLLLRVSDESINRAHSPADVLAAVDQVIPFIELPDLLVVEPGTLDGAAITAINVGARLGVMAAPIAVHANPAFLDALQSMQVIVRGNGAKLDSGSGADVLGHPLNAVIWLASDLARQGLALKPGDLVSLGSFSRLLRPEPGLKVEVQYLGLPGEPLVEVIFF